LNQLTTGTDNIATGSGAASGGQYAANLYRIKKKIKPTVELAIGYKK